MATIGEWIDAVIAKDGTESAEVDLGGVYRELSIYVPTIDSGTVAVHVATASGGTFGPLKVMNVDGTDEQILAGASVGGFYWRIPFGFQYLKVVVGAGQSTAERTFKVRGV